MPGRSIDDLSADELEELAKRRRSQDKQRAGSGRRWSFSVDLGDPDQIKLARRLGLDLGDDDEPADEPDEPDGDGDDPDATPARKGYFES